jgi:hypothetical protein
MNRAAEPGAAVLPVRFAGGRFSLLVLYYLAANLRFCLTFRGGTAIGCRDGGACGCRFSLSKRVTP